MQHISSHFDEPKEDRRATERGELMRYFMQKLNVTRTRDGLRPLTMARMGKALEAIPTDSLYYLKSVCDDAAKRGDMNSFSKRFWWEINPKKHEGEAGQNGVQSTPRTKRAYTKRPKPETDA